MHLPTEAPVMILPSATLFPQALRPLYIFEPRYRRMLADALKSNRMFSVAMQKPGRTREMPCHVAGLGLIRFSVDHEDGTSHLILQGIARVELGETLQYKPYRVNRIRPLRPAPKDSVMVDALAAKVHELVRERAELGPFPFPFPVAPKSAQAKAKGGAATKSGVSVKEILKFLENLTDVDQLADLVSPSLLTGDAERQTILETVEVEARLKHLIRFLMAEIQRKRKSRGK